MADAVLEPRPLESAHFGRPVFAATVASVFDVRALLDAAVALPDALVVVRLPSDRLAAAQALEDAGARLCDVLLTMSRSSPPRSVEAPSADGLVVRLGHARDAEALQALGALAFHDFVGHWHADTRTSGPLANAVYARWAAELARSASMERPMLVAATPDGQLVGFLALASTQVSKWHVPLAGVNPRYRGQGILAALLDSGVREVARLGDVHLDYETQLSNRAALRAVARCGFIPSVSRLTFHLWTDRP